MRIVPALDRGLRILALLAERDARMKVSEIAEVLGIPRSATYELIFTLVSHGAVRQFDNGEVGLGHMTLVLGSAYGRKLDFAQTAQAAAQSVAQTCDETVQIGVMDAGHVLYLAKADSTRPVRLVSNIGARVPAHCTALGKALLAYLSDDDLARYLDQTPLVALTERSIVERGELLAQLAAVRETGAASEECESNADVACVAAPVWNGQGINVAAMSIAVPVARMTPERRETLRAIVVQGAARLSEQLGYQTPRASRVDDEELA
jgi:DNA-binding IclR family transcriptional regulator